MKKRVVILGSTGSIGTSALKVARDIPERMEVVALAAHSNVAKLAEQAREFKVQHVCIYDSSKVAELQRLLPSGVQVYAGLEGLCQLATLDCADMVLVSIIGTDGLKPTLEAIEAGKDLAIASKEILVMAGEVVMNRAKARGINVLPVDSEHNAIYQCLQGNHGGAEQVNRLILTASGGPFRNTPREQLAAVTLEQALKHPTWQMGRKITIDSATMFNKGLEMIEARWLFDIPVSQIDVVVHPESIIHSLVEFKDGATLAQLSPPDMRVAIQYALTWPDRLCSERAKLDLAALGKLTFRDADLSRFPCLALAKRACAEGGVKPAILAAADEWAVAEFAAGRLSYTSIAETVERCLDAAPDFNTDSIESIMEANDWVWTFLSR
jgi:1-deoxy-D-xylulose-5-phosphate reductoisomerase